MGRKFAWAFQGATGLPDPIIAWDCIDDHNDQKWSLNYFSALGAYLVDDAALGD